jgi:dTDP-4-amino-4,6-dideoxygalactose transaminase
LVIHLERKGIETRYLLPLISQPIYSQLGDLRAAHPRATEALERGFYIGCHQGLGLKEMDYVASQIERFVWQARRTENPTQAR